MEVFHAGERTVQDLLNVRQMADSTGKMIQQTIPEKFATFLNNQTMMMIGSRDETGRVWGSCIVGEPGFIQVKGTDTILINGQINEFDPLLSNLIINKDVGINVIDFSSRIRIRINGVVLNDTFDKTIEVKVEQVYGNCPKFIQSRVFNYLPTQKKENKLIYRNTILNEMHEQWIKNSDTFIIASSSSEGKMDISHRGGMPGFIQVTNKNSLIFPDYPGNNLFNTLGNIIQNPNVGLFFFDFENGDTLQLTGKAQIIWEVSEQNAVDFPGAQRFIEFNIEEVLQNYNSRTYNWEFKAYSPFNPK